MMEQTELTADDYLHVPYVLDVWSEMGPDGDWMRHAEFPELPGCSVNALSAVEALERLDEMRVEYILTRLARGEDVPVPRPPLRS